MLHVELNPGIPGGRWARLRPLRGHDEASINGPDAVDLIAFLDSLLTNAQGTTVGPGKAADLAVCDCDRLFASIYFDYFGERIEGRMACADCRELFDLSFFLAELMGRLAQTPTTEVSGPDREGIFTLANGCRFRLPTAGDQRQLAGLDSAAAAAALLSRCIVEGEPSEDAESLQTMMEQVGPLLDLDLEAICPRCGTHQTVRFDIQSYLFRALAYERQFLNYEVHCIAMAYGWGYEEILSLTREDRRTFVGLIQSSRPQKRRLEA
ncbi:MAG TPA: hypothetical protein VF131_04660 [Blastocatellia bacterium]|nr:hypothetical protein [Blastocatellia bacterium]